MKYDMVGHAIRSKAPGEERSGSEQQKWIVIDGVKRFRVTYPKKHPGDIPIGTLQSIRKQLRLDKGDFEKFAKCTMSGAEYLAHLRELLSAGRL